MSYTTISITDILITNVNYSLSYLQVTRLRRIYADDSELKKINKLKQQFSAWVYPHTLTENQKTKAISTPK